MFGGVVRSAVRNPDQPCDRRHVHDGTPVSNEHLHSKSPGEHERCYEINLEKAAKLLGGTLPSREIELLPALFT